MDEVGRATQEAKAKSRYDVHGCTNVAVIWISKRPSQHPSFTCKWESNGKFRHSRECGNPAPHSRHTGECQYPVINTFILFSFWFRPVRRGTSFLLVQKMKYPRKKDTLISSPQIMTWGFPHSFMIFKDRGYKTPVLVPLI